MATITPEKKKYTYEDSLKTPDEKEIEIYLLKDNTYQLYQTYSKADTLESPTLKGLKIVLKEKF